MSSTFASPSAAEVPTISRPESIAAAAVALPQTRPARSACALGDIAASEDKSRRWLYLSAAIAAVSFLLLQIRDMNFCDPDLWHEMSLFRQTLVEGRVPTEDRFAYTPTVSPSIHHEWGSGALFYAVMTEFGAPGIMVFKYALVAAVLAACYWCARRRGASAATFLWVAPAMAPFSAYGFTTIRAQEFTLVLLAVMLCLLEIDRSGRRWWIALWLPLHVVWLNLHAGFVVGAVLMALHACEQVVRRRPFWHFVPIGAALAALVFVNPYGTLYFPYLWHGVTMARPLIVEWSPLWQQDPRAFTLYLLSLLPIGYAIRQVGLRQLPGILVLAASAYAAVRHTRHLSLYCVVWACYVPSYLQLTKVGTWIDQTYRKCGRQVMQVSVITALVCLCLTVPAKPWKLMLPSSNAAARLGTMCYPIGAVQFLEESDFHGNLTLPFEVGGYATWKLYPKARVSIDGRYEVAYQPGVLEDHIRLYEAESGWQDILTKYPTDAVLVPCLSRLSAAMPSMIGWRRAYRDGVYDVYTRPGLALR
jgi:hypothetical protein